LNILTMLAFTHFIKMEHCWLRSIPFLQRRYWQALCYLFWLKKIAR